MIRRRHHRLTKGFSLIELLVSLSLGLVITAGISQIYLQTKASYLLQTTLSTLGTQAQHALNLISYDIRNAGYLANTSSANAIHGSSPPIKANSKCDNSNQWPRMLEQTVYGMNDTNKINSTADYSKCVSNSDHLRGDILALRYVHKRTIPLNEVKMKDNKQRLYLLSSPEKGLLFEGQHHATNTLTSPLKSLHEISGSLFYVSKAIDAGNTNCANASAPYPALYREQPNSNGALQRQEMTQGIENIQFQYLIDNHNDKSSYRYVDASTTVPWPNVVAIRIWILARALCPEQAYTNTDTYEMGDVTFQANDNYRRLLLSTTVTINKHGAL